MLVLVYLVNIVGAYYYDKKHDRLWERRGKG